MIEKKCLNCGKKFMVKPYRKDTAKYCSSKCVIPKSAGWNHETTGIMKSNKTSFKKGNIPWNKGTKGICKSWNKGTKGICKPNSGSFKKGMRISPQTEFKKGMCGELSPSWQGGKTIGQKKRMLQEYKDWRLNVFKRDGFMCQICKQIGKELNAHHIKEWSKYPELRLEPNNGVTLCKECHLKIHRGGK